MVSAEWLKKAELFKALDESSLSVLLSASSEESFPEGGMIFKQGERANRLYVLIEGVVDLTVKTQERIDFMTSKIDGEGAVFGTASLMEPYHYNVTAICRKPTKVLTIEADHLKKRMDENLGMGMEIMKKLASLYFNRLNEMRSGVSNLLRMFGMKTP